MRFIENGFELSKPLFTALASIRNTKKGAHPACRLWYWDPRRTSLHVLGESMLLRVVGDIVEFAENDSKAYPFDVEILRKEVIPHIVKGTTLRVVVIDDGLVAQAVQDATDTDPEEVLFTVPLNHACCPTPPNTDMLDGTIPPMKTAASLRSPYIHGPALDSLAKVAKAMKANAVRFQPPIAEDDLAPIRADFALPETAGRWTAMLMPVKPV